MNTGNVTVKHSTNVLLAAYLTNRKALAKLSEPATSDLPMGVDRRTKVGMEIPMANPWR